MNVLIRGSYLGFYLGIYWWCSFISGLFLTEVIWYQYWLFKLTNVIEPFLYQIDNLLKFENKAINFEELMSLAKYNFDRVYFVKLFTQ